jgi:hypothetical protein
MNDWLDILEVDEIGQIIIFSVQYLTKGAFTRQLSSVKTQATATYTSEDSTDIACRCLGYIKLNGSTYFS